MALIAEGLQVSGCEHQLLHLLLCACRLTLRAVVYALGGSVARRCQASAYLAGRVLREVGIAHYPPTLRGDQAAVGLILAHR